MDKITEMFFSAATKICPARGNIDLSDHCRLDNRICIHALPIRFRDMTILSKEKAVVQLDLYIKSFKRNR